MTKTKTVGWLRFFLNGEVVEKAKKK